MDDDEVETLILRIRSLIKEADLARASSEDARTRSRIVKHDARLTRRRIEGGSHMVTIWANFRVMLQQ
jgi:hypothetical protein